MLCGIKRPRRTIVEVLLRKDALLCPFGGGSVLIKVSTSVTWGVGTSAEMSSLSSVVRSADYSFLTPFLRAMLALLCFCWNFYLFALLDFCFVLLFVSFQFFFSWSI